jgi:hypothetical protein
MDITEKLSAYVKACEVTGNGASTHCGDVRDAIAEIGRLRSTIRVNGLRQGATDEEINRVLNPS